MPKTLSPSTACAADGDVLGLVGMQAEGVAVRAAGPAPLPQQQLSLGQSDMIPIIQGQIAVGPKAGQPGGPVRKALADVGRNATRI